MLINQINLISNDAFVHCPPTLTGPYLLSFHFFPRPFLLHLSLTTHSSFYVSLSLQVYSYMSN